MVGWLVKLKEFPFPNSGPLEVRFLVVCFFLSCLLTGIYGLFSLGYIISYITPF